MSLNGKTIAVTGAFGSLGTAVVKALFEQGATVAAIDLADAPRDNRRVLVTDPQQRSRPQSQEPPLARADADRVNAPPNADQFPDLPHEVAPRAGRQMLTAHCRPAAA